MDVCIIDTFFLFEIAGILNILLFLCAWVKFDSFWVRIVFAFDLALALKFVVETAVGENVADWPQGIAPNLFIVVMFTLGFYVLAPNIWGCVFLVLGLLSVESFWNSVWDQICSFFRHSLNITMEETNSKVAFAALVVFILFVVAMTIFFALPIVQLVVFGFVLAAKAMIGYRFNEIRIVEREQVCCATQSDPEQCPIWFTKWHWFFILFLTVSRIWFSKYIAKHSFCGIQPTGYNLLTNEKVDTDDSATGADLTPPPPETTRKPTVSLRKVQGKAATVSLSVSDDDEE